jgi:hypothetical protein
MPSEDLELVQKNLYGIGISPLSIANRDRALPEEMMANKDIGLFFIAAKDGDYALSAEYVTRCKAHLKEFIKQCVHENTLGKVYKIFIDRIGTQTVDVTKNLFVNTLKYPLSEPIKAFRFGIDADLIAKEHGIAIDPRKISFRISFTLAKGDSTKDYYIEETFDSINSKAFAVDMSMLDGEGGYSFTINTFQVTVPNDFDATSQAIVIYDILLALI